MQEWEEKALVHEKGIKEGIEKMNILTKYLLENNRIDDLMRATTNLQFRETLFVEYEIE